MNEDEKGAGETKTKKRIQYCQQNQAASFTNELRQRQAATLSPALYCTYFRGRKEKIEVQYSRSNNCWILYYSRSCNIIISDLENTTTS